MKIKNCNLFLLQDTMEARALRNRSQEGSPASRGSYDDLPEEEPEDQIEEEEEEETEELPPYLPSVYGCRNMDEFEVRFL